MLEVRGLTAGYGAINVLWDVDLAFAAADRAAERIQVKIGDDELLLVVGDAVAAQERAQTRQQAAVAARGRAWKFRKRPKHACYRAHGQNGENQPQHGALIIIAGGRLQG